MVKKFILPIILVLFPILSEAKETPVDVVRNFGKVLATWCRTGDIANREKLEQLCNGVKKCRVEDKIHADYQAKRGLCDYNTFVLESYLNMFETIMPNGLSYQMSDIKTETQDNMPEGQTLTFITATIHFGGKINCEVKDLFLVRDDKISGIYSYSSQLGFSHLNGSLIKALQEGHYIWTAGFKNGFAVVSNEVHHNGLIDVKGNVIIPCIWDAVDYIGGNFARGFNFKNENKESCYYDLRRMGKNVPIHHIQDWIVGRDKKVMTFSEGFAVVNNGEKYGYLKENDLNYKNIKYIYDDACRFSEGYAFVKINGKGAIIDKQFNTVITDNEKYEVYGNSFEGLFCIKDIKTGKWGFVNPHNKVVIPCIYDEVDRFSNGICCVHKFDSPSRNLNYQTYRVGCINRKGKLIMPYIYDGNLGGFEDGYIEMYKEIDGKIKGTLIGEDGLPLPGFSWQYDDVRRFCNGLARFEVDKKFGFLDKNGKVVIPAVYDLAMFFHNGYACVGKKINGKMKYGCINADGALVIPFIYNDTFSFNDGIALVTKDGITGLTDVFGNSCFFN